MPNLYIISGCNGAGKTTASYTVLPEMLDCKEFVNADNIAAGISPFNPELISFEAGRIMLKRIEQLRDEKVDFAFETTLSSKNYVSFIKIAKKEGYKVNLIYFWLRSAEQAKMRVAARVQKGGHNIDPEIIERRYYRGIKNLFHLYMPIADYWIIMDNSNEQPHFIAEGEKDGLLLIHENDSWQKIKNIADAN